MKQIEELFSVEFIFIFDLLFTGNTHYCQSKVSNHVSFLGIRVWFDKQCFHIVHPEIGFFFISDNNRREDFSETTPIVLQRRKTNIFQQAQIMEIFQIGLLRFEEDSKAFGKFFLGDLWF